MVGVTTAWGAALEGHNVRRSSTEQAAGMSAEDHCGLNRTCLQKETGKCVAGSCLLCFPMGTENKEGKIYCNTYFLPSTSTSRIP